MSDFMQPPSPPPPSPSGVVAAQNYVRNSLVPQVLPQVITLVVLCVVFIPLASAYACFGGKHRCFKRPNAVRTARFYALISALFAALVLHQLLLLIDTVSVYHAVVLTAFTEAGDFACADAAAPPAAPPSSASASLCHAASPSSCSDTSIVGFTSVLGGETSALLASILALLSDATTSTTTLPAIANISTAAGALAAGAADDLVALNGTLATASAVFSSLYTTASPYFAWNPTAWTPVSSQATLASDGVGSVPASALDTVRSLGKRFTDGGSSVGTLDPTAALGSILGESGDSVDVTLSRANQSVQDALSLAATSGVGLRRTADSLCRTTESIWRSAGLPVRALPPQTSGTYSTSLNPSQFSTLSSLNGPALTACIGIGALLLLPSVFLCLAATTSTETERRITISCCCGILSLMMMPALVLVTVLSLLAAPALHTACAPGSVDALLDAQLTPFGNVTLLPSSLTLTIGSSGFVATTSGPPPSVAVTQLVRDALRCGEAGGPSNLVDLLNARGALDAGVALANNLSNTLSTQLDALEAAAVVPLATLLSNISSQNLTALLDTSAAIGAYDAQQLADINATLANVSSFLPSSSPPSGASDIVQWRATFHALYNTSSPFATPTPEERAVNDQIHADVLALRSATAAIDRAVAVASASDDGAPALQAQLVDALVAAQAQLSSAMAAGRALQAQLTRAIGLVASIESVAACAWVPATWGRVTSLTCGQLKEQTTQAGWLGFGAAIFLLLGLLTLLCVQPVGFDNGMQYLMGTSAKHLLQLHAKARERAGARGANHQFLEEDSARQIAELEYQQSIRRASMDSHRPRASTAAQAPRRPQPSSGWSAGPPGRVSIAPNARRPTAAERMAERGQQLAQTTPATTPSSNEERYQERMSRASEANVGLIREHARSQEAVSEAPLSAGAPVVEGTPVGPPVVEGTTVPIGEEAATAGEGAPPYPGTGAGLYPSADHI